MRDREPEVLSASTLIGDKVENPEGESLGKLEEIMIDVESGRVAYAVVSFGGFMGMGDKLFAFPWGVITVDRDRERIVIDIDQEALEDAPGFDKDHWPDSADRTFVDELYAYYETAPFYAERL